MPARIFRPARTAMQSGTAKTQDSVLAYTNDTTRHGEPVMGWTRHGAPHARVGADASGASRARGGGRRLSTAGAAVE